MAKDQATSDLTKMYIKVSLIFFSIFIVLAIIFFTMIKVLNLTFFSVSGTSMEPTLKNQSYVILQQEDELNDDLITFFNKPHKWDGFYHKETVFVKRVMAKPGDVLQYDGKRLLVNGEEKYNFDDNGYVCRQKNTNYTHKLSENEIFAAGDNSTNSLDSRFVFCQSDDTERAYVPLDNLIEYGTIWKNFSIPTINLN